MSKIALSLFILTAVTGCIPVFAVDGVVLINQASVTAAGGFPFKITQTGSYKLSGNLDVPAGINGIEINVNDVTLDLNGFTITGPITCDSSGCTPTSTASPSGIQAFAVGITIRNGHVKGFARGVKTFGGLVEEMHVSGNVIDGIEGNDVVVRRNDASSNHGIGIQCFDCVVTENVATLNGSNAFFMGGGGVFASNTTKSSLGVNISLSSLVVTQRNSSCDGFAC
jgi:hypothetical protein